MNEGKRRFLPLSVAVIIMAIAALLGSRVTIDNDISRLLPDSSPEISRSSRALEQLMNRTIIDVGAETTPVTVDTLGRVADTLAVRLTASGQVFRVRARMNVDEALPVVDLLRDHAALLLDAKALNEIEAAIKPDVAVATIQKLARRIQEIDGAPFKARAAIDPLGITDRVLAPLSALGESFGDTRLIDGRITTADGRHVLVVVEVKCAPNDTENNERYLSKLQQIITDLQTAPENAGVRIRFAGAHRATLDNVRQIRSDVFLTTGIGVSVVAVLAILCFGRIWLSLLALTPALFGGVCAWGMFSLFQETTSGAVLGFGAVLLGLTIDFAVHVLFRLDRSRDESKKVTLPVRALFMGGTTTILAFVALHSSSLPALRDVGTFGAIGIFAAVLFALYVLPTLVRSPKRAKPIVDLKRIVEKLARPAMPAMIVAAALTPAFAIGCLFVEFDGDPTHLSALTPAAAQDDATIQAVWGRSRQNTALVIENRDLSAALTANDRLRAWLDERVETDLIRRHGSISGLLPSPETQRERLRMWHAFWSRDRVETLRKTLDRATAESLFHAGAFAPFVSWLAKSPTILTYEKESEGPMQPLLADRMDFDDGLWRITTPVFADKWEQIEELDKQLHTEFPDVTLLNRQAFARKLASMVTGEVGTLGLLAFLLVGTVVFLWHGRWLITFAILLPLLLSLVWTLGLLGWVGIPISLANAIFVVLLFGVAVDYAIFLASSRIDRFRTGVDRVTESQASVLLCTLTTCGGFGSLAAAGHPVMHSIGLTALIGIFSAALTTQIFVPAMTSALLLRRGPNGTPGVPNALAGMAVFRMMVGRGMWHMLTHRRSADDTASQRAAIDCIHEMGKRLRDHPNFGSRVFSGEDKLLREPCVFVANHESMYDIMAVLSLPRPTQLLVKGWVWNMPVMGHMVRRAGYILAQESELEEVFAHAKHRLKCGHSLLVFPEGKRTRTGRIGRFHSGAFAIARRLGVKVQPIAMVNTRAVVPHQAWWLGDHTANICVLDPMDPADFAGDGGDRRMARAARDSVRDHCRQTWMETQFGARWFHMVGGMYRYLGPLITHYAVSKCKRDPLIRELPNLCSGDGPILVAGGGFGLMTSRLALAFPERKITCVDIDEHKLQVARSALGDQFPVDFVIDDLRTFNTAPVDLLLLIDVLHYWDDANQKQILHQLSQSLSPGGRLLFRDGCNTGDSRHKLLIAQEFVSVMTGFTRNQGKFLFRSEDEWRTVLEACGFAIEASRGDLGTFSNLVLICRRSDA